MNIFELGLQVVLACFAILAIYVMAKEVLKDGLTVLTLEEAQQKVKTLYPDMTDCFKVVSVEHFDSFGTTWGLDYRYTAHYLKCDALNVSIQIRLEESNG